tara:strand:- start:558 stop:1610 length:1053 start_codon:yes stop_codon:yes gene_type:complete
MAQEPDLVAEVGGSALLKEVMQQNFKDGGIVDLLQKFNPLKKIKRLKKPIVDLYDKFTKKKTATPPASKKKLTKKQKAKAAKKAPPQTALEKANQFKKPPGGVGSGPLTQTAIKAVEKGLPALKSGASKVVNYAVRDLPAIAGLGALGYGLSEYFGETEEEALIREKEAFYNSPAEKRKREDEAKELQNAKDEQERADIAEKQRRASNKRAYLALALGGAKTMAGESPFALTNIGAGLGTGVASLVELDEAAAARQSAELLADAKLRNDLYKESRDQMDTFNKLKLELRGGLDQTFTQIFLGRLDDKGIDRADVTNPDYIKIENETILDLYPGSAPAGSTVIDGQPFIGV